MKFIVEKAVILKALGHGQSIVERKHTLPILANIKLEAFKDEKGDFIKLTSTNTEIEISEIIPAVISEVGTTTASAARLYYIIKELKEGAQVEISTADDDAKMTIKSGRAKFVIGTIDAEGFFVMENAEMPTKFKISPQDLKVLINNTSFATATDGTHFYLVGIYLHEAKTEQGSVLRAVATDGHRMACQDVSLPLGAEGMNGAIIPKKALEEIKKLLEEQVDDIDVALSNNAIVLNFKTLKFTANLINGTYPDYVKVIPVGNDKSMEINSSLFAEAIDRMAILADKNNVLKVNIRKDMVLISSNNPEDGSSEEEVDAIYMGDAMEIGFNYRYLKDILERVPGMVKISFLESSKPVLLQGVELKDSLYVLMPMRV